MGKGLTYKSQGSWIKSFHEPLFPFLFPQTGVKKEMEKVVRGRIWVHTSTKVLVHIRGGCFCSSNRGLVIRLLARRNVIFNRYNGCHSLCT